MTSTGRSRPMAALVVVALMAGACTGSGGRGPAGLHDPAASISPSPDYAGACSPSGRDVSTTCIGVELRAIDNARAMEHLGPLVLPANFGHLSDAEQLFVALDRERADRGLPVFAGVSAVLNANAAEGAAAARLPGNPGAGFASVDTEWIGAVANALDAEYVWMYGGGPGGAEGCAKAGDSGCWADRHALLDDFGHGRVLVMGADLNPTADTTTGDVGGVSFAVTLATQPAQGPLAYTWTQALADAAVGSVRPLAAAPSNSSASHIPDPPRTVPASPDFTRTCAAGLDRSPACLGAVLLAVDAARAKEGVKPMVLPAGFAAMTVPQQIFVAINLERTDRGLRPFAGLLPALNRNAQVGADTANDPPDPGDRYTVADTEWAGGSSNGLDADYGWMYDDGIGSGNLDCPKTGGPGCWGHRHGILDDFGTVGTLLMGAALNPTGDTGPDEGGPSMAATLAVTTQPAGPLAFTGAFTGPSTGPFPGPSSGGPPATP